MLQEALDTLVVRIVEEKAEPLVATVVDPPDPSDLADPADLIAVLDMYLALMRPAKDILGEFVTQILKELPVKTNAQHSLEALSSILQVRFTIVGSVYANVATFEYWFWSHK